MDVESGLRPGDEFRVIYENLWQTGLSVAQPGTILGASVASAGHTLTAVYFEDEEGHGAYFRPSGDAISRMFLRYPLDFTEITSEFSLFRQHPILHRERPHYGVDFAAPSGTPVRAAATGSVSYSGWIRGLGRCVKIDHADAVTSTYGHLSRIVTGLDVGSQVERGQVIGFVGSSGLATGPHLHYALEKEGLYIDPLSLRAAPDRSIPVRSRRTFERVQREVLGQLATLPPTSRPQTVSLSRAAFPSAADPRE